MTCRLSLAALGAVWLRAAEAGGTWKLSGTKVVVPAGDEADAFVVSARAGGAECDAAGVALFIVDKAAAGLTLQAYPTQDGARAATLVLADTPATPRVCIATQAWRSLSGSHTSS